MTNLDGRLGFYSLYFYLGAFVVWFTSSPEATLYINLVASLLFVGWACYQLFSSELTALSSVILISLPGLLFYEDLIAKSLSQDVGAYMMLVVFLFYYLQKVENEWKIQFWWIVAMIGLIVSIKMSMIFLGVIVLFFINDRSVIQIKQNIPWFVLSVALIGLVIWHNYWLSGWLLYPTTAIDLFNPDWKVPDYLVQNQQDVTAAFAKSSGSLEHVYAVNQMSLTEWVPIWFDKIESNRWVIYSTVLSMIVSWLLLGLRKKIQIKSIIALIVTLNFAAIMWFLSAPSFRFGFVLLYGNILVSAYLLQKTVNVNNFYLPAFKIVSLGLVLLFYMKSSGLGSALTDGYPPLMFNLKVEIPKQKLKQVSHPSYPEEMFYTPTKGERGYWSDKIPVASRIYTNSLMPFINDVPRWRGESVEDGFWTDSVETVRLK